MLRPTIVAPSLVHKVHHNHTQGEVPLVVTLRDILQDLLRTIAKPALPEERSIAWERWGVPNRVSVLLVKRRRHRPPCRRPCCCYCHAICAANRLRGCGHPEVQLLLCCDIPATKRHFCEFSLCLSRACLGKIIMLTYKWLKKDRFVTSQSCRWS